MLNLGSDISEGYFNFYVPLRRLLGFFEDYKHVVVNARRELMRARNDNNCIVGSPITEPQIELFKVLWRMSYIMLNGINKLTTGFRKQAISQHEF